jgi:uncharacterized membrane protein
MNRVVVAFLSPITMGKYLTFSFTWAVIATMIQLPVLLYSGRSLNIVSFFFTLSLLGLAFSYSRFGEEFKKNKLELDWWQGLRSIPAIVLIVWVSRHPNAVSTDHREWSALFIFFIGFWSSQFAALIRRIFQLKS